MGEGADRAGLAARAGAVALLDAVLGAGQLLSQAVADPAVGVAALAPSGRARAQRLATETLRHLGRADAALAPFLRKTPPETLRNILRLGVYELSLDAAGAHGVVNAAVGLARKGKGGSAMAGLVNAVLRKVAATPDPFAGMPVGKMPPWLRGPCIAAYGKKAVQAMEAVQARAAPLDLTLKPGMVADLTGAVVLPNGTVRLAQVAQVTGLPGYAAGNWWVQDAAAAMAVPLLDPKPGERVLELCAAPGGKTLQLAAAGARVTAVDLSERRLGRLRENLARTGLVADVVVADALVWEPEGAFDAILLDAPCSATGTLRRHPDLPYHKDGSDKGELVALQAALIDRAIGWLKPGGRMVYGTCSLLPVEGEAQLEALLARHPGVTVEQPALPWVPQDWVTAAGGLRLRPDHWADLGGMDGFFLVRLRKA
jgi:16S rRNA (cytosine967-C5)-methyltransferase